MHLGNAASFRRVGVCDSFRRFRYAASKLKKGYVLVIDSVFVVDHFFFGRC